MPLVFVHGIANRESDKFKPAVGLREALFRTYLLGGRRGGAGFEHEVISPYWGDLGGRLRWNGASFPLGSEQALGGAADPVGLVEAVASDERLTDPDRLLVDTAKMSFADAVDLMFSACALDDAELPVAELALLATRLEGVGAAVVAVNDDEFLRTLENQVGELAPGGESGWDSMGIGRDVWTWLRRGMNRLKRSVVRAGEVPAAKASRRLAIGAVPLLVGDVAAYLAQRGTPEEPGPIPGRVLSAIDTAMAAAPDAPLIVVAHSMGGNIVHDLLTYFRPGLRVDALVTVGSQVGLFEELKLFGASENDVPGAGVTRAAKPAGVGKWLNVVDDCDPLAFRAAPIFEGVEDFRYPSGAVWAHSAYLAQPNFHRRLAHRLDGQPV